MSTMESVCSFCGERPVVAWFQGPDFRIATDSPQGVQAEEARLACSTCRALVDAGDREELVERAWHRLMHAGWTSDRPSRAQLRDQLDRLFWTPRSA